MKNAKPNKLYKIKKRITRGFGPVTNKILSIYVAKRNDSREKVWLLPEIDCVKKKIP